MVFFSLLPYTTIFDAIPGSPDASRKSAFCTRRLTQKRTLTAHLTKRRILHASSHTECAFP